MNILFIIYIIVFIIFYIHNRLNYNDINVSFMVSIIWPVVLVAFGLYFTMLLITIPLEWIVDLIRKWLK